ncbi:MAG: YvrJ family protein [Firmicutes bacterium]|nr:YvrJ family protein [Bacillota bacterium]
MQELLPQIANVGFPVVLSMYLLVRIEGKLEVLSNAISDLTRAIMDSR